MDKVLIKGTVEHIFPVIEHNKEIEEENNWIKEPETKGEAMKVSERKRSGPRKKVKYFQVHLQEGIILKAHQVVMATGPTRSQMANIPSWVKNIGESYPEERLQHTVNLMHHLANSKQKRRETNCPRQNETFSTQGKSDFLAHNFQNTDYSLLPEPYMILQTSVTI